MAYCILLGLQVDLTGKLNHEEKKALLLRRLLLRVGEVCMEGLQPSKITLLQHRHAGLSSLYTREGGPKSFTPMIPAPSAQNPQNKRYTSMRITATNLLKEKRFPGPPSFVDETPWLVQSIGPGLIVQGTSRSLPISLVTADTRLFAAGIA